MSASSNSWRVVLFTVTAQVVPWLDDWLASKGHRLVGIVTAAGPRTRRTDDYLAVAQHARPGLDVIVSNYPKRWADMIRPLRPDLIVVLSFNWKIPDDVLSLPPLGVINGHDAPLPKYRGRNATGWILRNDEHEAGMTVHYMVSELDAGPILSQRRYPITDDDLDIEPIFQRFVAAHDPNFSEAFARIAAGDPGDPQDESQATYASGAFEPEWRLIDWSKPARDIFLQIRSWYGNRDCPRGAFGEVDGKTLLITKTKQVDLPSSDQVPGTVLRRDDDGILVQCGDRPLLLIDFRPATQEEIEEAGIMAESSTNRGRANSGVSISDSGEAS